MSTRTDLTRWNRAGLSRFRYVDGNAVDYLEILRQQLFDKFKDPRTDRCEWLLPAVRVPADEQAAEAETLGQRQVRLNKIRQRLLESYHQDRRDWAWEISRTFARACHILTEHVDAYANEGYLGTATQWEHVRRLVEMLDYHPAPPASAFTRLVFIAKGDKAGLVPKGFQVKHSPPEGGPKVVFETLEDLTIDPALNALHPKGWNRPQGPAIVPDDPAESPSTAKKAPLVTTDDQPGHINTLWRATSKPKPDAGQVAMVVHQSKNRAEAAIIGRIDDATAFIALQPQPEQDGWISWPKSEAVLHVSPRWKRTCWLNGDDVIRTEQPHGFSKGAYIGWKHNDAWQYATVDKADKRSLRLKDADELPQEGDALHELLPMEGAILPAEFEAVVLVGDSSPLDVEAVSPTSEAPPDPDVSKPKLEEIFSLKEVPSCNTDDAGGGGFLLPPASLPKIGSFLFPSPFLPLDLVKAAVELMLNIGAMAIPSTEEVVFKGMPFGGLLEGDDSPIAAATALFEMLDNLTAPIPQCDGNGNQLFDDGNPVTIEEDLVVWQDLDADGNPNKEAIIEDLAELLTAPEGEDATTLFQKIKNDMAGKGPLLAIPKDPAVKAVVDAMDQWYLFDGQADKIETGDWVVGRFDEVFRALKIQSINEITDADESVRFALKFESSDTTGGSLTEVFADFRGQLAAEGADKNDASLDTEIIELEDTPPENLTIGREVLIVGCGDPVVRRITAVNGSAISIDPPLIGCTLGELIVYGNVVNAGHGESKPVKILGSGNAARSNQEFTLDVDDLSFTPDPTKRSGVAAALDVEVDGRIWEQVSTLKDSAADDHHYVVRMTETGRATIRFGDGVNGRRLPSGRNNIRVRYRVGSGPGGNLDEGSLVKPVKPHPLVKDVLQPLPSAGGGGMEDAAALRNNAPATLLTLERAVSLSDFAHLAASQSSVWQARAHRRILHGGKAQSVAVVIVPVDGVRSESINDAVRAFLQKHALPGVQVTVDSFEPQLFDLEVTIRVRTGAFIADAVKRAVAAALEAQFRLKQRTLGQPLYLSEVYRVVEGIRGVENSICVLNKAEKNQVIEAQNDRSVIYLDTADKQRPSTLLVHTEDFRP